MVLWEDIQVPLRNGFEWYGSVLAVACKYDGSNIANDYVIHVHLDTAKYEDTTFWTLMASWTSARMATLLSSAAKIM